MARKINRDARLEALKRANAADAVAVNRAIASGAVIRIVTAYGDYQITRVTGEFDWYAQPMHTARGYGSERWFMGANDGRWLEILRQAGVTQTEVR